MTSGAGNGEKDSRPIIIRKKIKRKHGHHGGAWKVAYADFVTAMMAFFLVMWITSQSDEIKMNISGYFQDPVAFGQAGGVTLLEGGAVRKGGDEKSAQTVILYDQDAAMKAQLEKEAKEIMEALDQISSLKDIMDQIEVEATEEGLRIQLMETEDSHFFEIGGAKLSPAGTEVVSAIGRLIGPLGREVAIEGHTDSHQYSGSSDYTNWELSVDRANSSRWLLQGSGVNPEQVREIRGYADKRLKYPENPTDARNRRISILVLNRRQGGDAAAEDTAQAADSPSPGQSALANP
jgi:chemotaxis protein MotB